MVDISQSRNRKSHKIIVHIYIYILYLVCGNKERREMFIDLWLEDFSSGSLNTSRFIRNTKRFA